MNRSLHLAVPLLASLSFAGAAAAQHVNTRPVSTVLLMRCGPSDIVVNAPLLDALLAEPAAQQHLRDAVGEQFHGLRIQATLPAAHLPGTYQVHLLGELRSTGEWTEELEQRTVEAVIDHLRTRLDALLYTEPLARLSQRADELSHRQMTLASEVEKLRTRYADGDQELQTARTEQATVQHELLAAKLSEQTEREARRHLQNLRETLLAQRGELSTQLIAAEDRVADGVAEATAMRQKLIEFKPDSEPAKALQKSLAQTTRYITDARNALADTRHQLTDCEAMLTQVLEQLPATELQLQRAESRQKGLQGATREVKKRLSQLEKEGSARRSKELELYEIDLTVLRQQLIEVKGQLARLVPVRYELLRQR